MHDKGCSRLRQLLTGSLPNRLHLGLGCVHVWRVAADAYYRDTAAAAELLADHERAQARRFRRKADSMRWVIARALLRVLLSRYLGSEPSSLRFCHGPYGKPQLAVETIHPDIHFNLSHSEELILFAISRDNVGVDVEKIWNNIDTNELAERFFRDSEIRALKALPSSLQREAFFAVWTRKEAYLKGRGLGLSEGLDGFEVSVDPLSPARLLGAATERLALLQWSVSDLGVRPGYRAAVATEHPAEILLLSLP